jgi:HlyD family secretion protein
VEFARRNNTRAQQLFDQKLVSQSSLDDAKSALELAENRKRAAGGQLVISQAKVVEATANVAQARAAVERAEEELANSTIKAPIRPRCSHGRRDRQPRVVHPQPRRQRHAGDDARRHSAGVRARQVDEADIGRVRLGQSAKITTESFPDKVFEGRVTQISPIGVEKDNVTTFEVKVSIDNAGKELKANMTANAEIVLEQFADSLLVPEAAVVFDAQRKPFVDLVDPGSKTGRRRVPVTTGVGNGTKMQIREADQGRRQGRPSGLGFSRRHA